MKELLLAAALCTSLLQAAHAARAREPSGTSIPASAVPAEFFDRSLNADARQGVIRGAIQRVNDRSVPLHPGTAAAFLEALDTENWLASQGQPGDPAVRTALYEGLSRLLVRYAQDRTPPEQAPQFSRVTLPLLELLRLQEVDGPDRAMYSRDIQDLPVTGLLVPRIVRDLNTALAENPALLSALDGSSGRLMRALTNTLRNGLPGAADSQAIVIELVRERGIENTNVERALIDLSFGAPSEILRDMARRTLECMQAARDARGD